MESYGTFLSFDIHHICIILSFYQNTEIITRCSISYFVMREILKSPFTSCITTININNQK